MRRERESPAHLRMKTSLRLNPAQTQEEGAHCDLKYKWHNHRETKTIFSNCDLFIQKTS